MLRQNCRSGVRIGRESLTGCLLVLGLALAGSYLHCGGQTNEGIDMAGPPFDLGMSPDLSNPPLPLNLSQISLVAGSLGGTGNIDGTGSAARFNYLTGMAADGSGNLFVADAGSCTIRKVVVSTGTVTTLAGTVGMCGSTDGTGAAARFSNPGGMAADGSGNLFVADAGSHTIRKIVVSTGAVTTLAGTAGMSGSADGTGTAALFNAPRAVAADGSGNLFVADSSHTIRQVVVTTGVVTTLAGSTGSAGSTDGTGGAARFNFPRGVAADGSGNLFVADMGNSTIRRVVVSTGAVTTLAGTAGSTGGTDGTGAAARFFAPHCVAVDGSGNLFVADTLPTSIRKVVVATAAVTTLAGVAGFGSVGIAVDGSGNLFIADQRSSVVRTVVLATRASTTLAGAAGMPGSASGIGADARFNAPNGVAVDGQGNLFIADTSNNWIRRVELASGEVTTLATGFLADCVAADGKGNVYYPDWGTIKKLEWATGAITTLVGTERVYGCSDGTGAAALVSKPRGMAMDGRGNLYIADTECSTIRKLVLATGEITTLAGRAGSADSIDGTGFSARFNKPFGVALDDADNLYVADSWNSTIRKVVIATRAVTTVAGAAGVMGSTDGAGGDARFDHPFGVAADGYGNLYVADQGNHTIRKVELATFVVTTLVGVPGQVGVRLGPLPAGLNAPAGLAVSRTGELFLSDPGENAVLVAR